MSTLQRWRLQSCGEPSMCCFSSSSPLVRLLLLFVNCNPQPIILGEAGHLRAFVYSWSQSTCITILIPLQASWWQGASTWAPRTFPHGAGGCPWPLQACYVNQCIAQCFHQNIALFALVRNIRWQWPCIMLALAMAIDV